MKQEFPELAEAQPVMMTGAIRRAITRRTLLATSTGPVVGVIGGVAAHLAFNAWSGAATMWPFVASGLIGLTTAAVTARWLAKKSAEEIAQPIELVAAHLMMSGDDIASSLLLPNSRRPSPSQLAADIALLESRFAEAENRSRSLVKDLQLAREQANLQNLAKSQFLANMSHELRTPLNAVLGYAMLLQEDAVAEDNQSAIADLDRIQLAGRHLLKLINDLLDLSKIESGKTTVDRSVLDIESFVVSITAGFSDKKLHNGNGFETVIEPDLGVMIGDETKLRQCLNSILDNAFKFSQDGNVVLDVRLANRGDRVPSVVFSVTDTGIGFDPAKMNDIFESFNQADNSSSRTHGGTGLGLAITRRLARLMDGDVSAESPASGGATFRLTVPVNSLSNGANYSPAEATDQAESATSNFVPDSAKQTALVIDDNESALDLMRRWLERLNYNVVTATDGNLGLAEAKKHKFELIILDVLMPGRSGYDVLAQLREDEKMASTPIILVTVEDDRVRGLNAGASEYMRKPIGEQQLREMLEVYQTPTKGDVLIIEDDDDAAELVKRCAEQVGCNVRRAADGGEGIDMVREKRPNAIVLDLAMPRFDGFKVIEALRADESLADIPVIILSAREISLQDHQKIADAGYKFCSKGSLSPREIAAHLKEMVA